MYVAGVRSRLNSLQLRIKTSLVILGYCRAFGFVAFVEESEAEGCIDGVEDRGVLGPCDNGTRRHDGGNVAGHEALAREVGHGEHRLERRLSFAQ